jgi:hypothetical protein
MREQDSFDARALRAGLSERERVELADHIACAVEQRERGAAAAGGMGERRIDLERDSALRAAVTRLGDLCALASELRAQDLRRVRLQRALGLAFVALALCAVPMAEGVLGGLLAAAPVGWLVLLVLAGLFAGFGPARCVDAFRVAWGAAALEPERARAAVALFERGEKLAWAAGPITFLMLAAVRASSLSDMPSLWSGLASAALALPAGAILGALGFGTLAAWAREACRDASASATLAREGP